MLSSNKRSINAGATAENVGTGPRILWSIHAINVGTVAVYLKLYNKASATQADTPVATYCIPTSGGAEGAGFTINFEGLEFATACSFRVTTEVADSGTTSPATNAVILNVEHSQCGVAAITGA